jgi:hypothetical protein
MAAAASSGDPRLAEPEYAADVLYELSFKPRNAAAILRHAACMAALSSALARHAALPACLLHPVVHIVHNLVHCPDAAAALLCTDGAAAADADGSEGGGLVPALAGCLLSDGHFPSHPCDSQTPASPFVAAVAARTLQRLALYAQAGAARRALLSHEGAILECLVQALGHEEEGVSRHARDVLVAWEDMSRRGAVAVWDAVRAAVRERRRMGSLAEAERGARAAAVALQAAVVGLAGEAVAGRRDRGGAGGEQQRPGKRAREGSSGASPGRGGG